MELATVICTYTKGELYAENFAHIVCNLHNKTIKTVDQFDQQFKTPELQANITNPKTVTLDNQC